MRIEQLTYRVSRPFWDTSDPKSEQILEVLRKPALMGNDYSLCGGIIIDKTFPGTSGLILVINNQLFSKCK